MSTPRRPTAPRAARPPAPTTRRASRRPGASRPAASRPATRAPGAAATRSTTGQPASRTSHSAEHVQPKASRLLSVRALVLLVVVGVAFSLLAPTVRSYFQQRGDLAALESEVASATQREAELTAQLARWDDPAYVMAQARERLVFVMPGEIAYRVVDPQVATPAEPDEPEPTAPVPGVLTPNGEIPWYLSIWESVQVAGYAELEPLPGTDDDDPDGDGEGQDLGDDGSGAADDSPGTDGAEGQE